MYSHRRPGVVNGALHEAGVLSAGECFRYRIQECSGVTTIYGKK